MSRGLDDRAERCNQQLAAEVLAVEILCEGELGEEDRGDVTRSAATGLLRQCVAVDGVRCDREVPDHRAALIDQHRGPSALTCCGVRVVVQPSVEFRVAAAELAQVVTFAEWLDLVGQRRVIRR